MSGPSEPATREYVKEQAEDQQHTHTTTPVGPGLLVVYRAGNTDTRGYDGLTTSCGWYVAWYCPDDNGDMAVLMPITEVLE